MSRPEEHGESIVEKTIAAPDQAVDLDTPLRVRVPLAVAEDLDSVEAFFRGQRFRHVTRSHLVRVALEGYIEAIRITNPEIFE